MEHSNGTGFALSNWLSWFGTRGAQRSKHDPAQQQDPQASVEPRDKGANRRQVLVVQENQEDPEFMDVTPQHLSYAEAASMAIQQRDDQQINSNNSNAKNYKVQDDEQDTIVDSKDLDAEVLDYQMSEFMKRNVKHQNFGNDVGVGGLKSSILDNDWSSAYNNDSQAIDIEEAVFNDKHHRRSKKAKFLKKGK